MNPILKNVLIFIVSIIVGSIVNMALILLGMMLMTYPEGVSAMDPESIKANIDQFKFVHYIFPWLAHAVGTFVGAVLITKFAANNQKTLALLFGGLYLVGGVFNAIDLQAPMAFNIIDITLAYIPMAWLGHKIAS